MEPIVKLAGLTVLAALLIAFLEFIIKVFSRFKRLMGSTGSVGALATREDLAVWNQWIVATQFASGFTVFRAVFAAAPVPPGLFVYFIIVLIVGLIFLPFGIGYLLCDTNGGFPSIRNALIADAIGLIFLTGAVVFGVRVYG